MLVCHTCDNPGCVNPDHLYLGTYQDNANDMYARGRANKDNRKGPKGYRHLSQAIAEEIRKDREVTGDSHAKIAERFGTSREQVRDIVNGIIWK